MSGEFIGLGTDGSDPDSIAAEAFDYLIAEIPDWEPAAGNLETIMLEAFSQEAAIERELAAQTGVEIFRAFGELVGTTPLDPVAASGTADFVLLDEDGHLLPLGTQFTVEGPAGPVAFQTTADALVNPTEDTILNVPIEAVETGIDGNDLSGDGSLVDALLYVDTITVDASTSGGTDGETDDEYLDRLSERLTLQSPRPILPRDFEILARDIAGVERAVAIDNYAPGTNEQQTITHDGTGGTFTLTFEAQTTGNIDWDATAAEVQTALEALSNIAPGDIAVTGGALPTLVTVEFIGTLRASNRTQMTEDDTNLTGDTAGVTVTTTVGGVAELTTEERTITLALADEDGEAVSPAIEAEVDAYLETLREVNFVVWTLDPVYKLIDVVTTVVAYAGYDADDVDTNVTAALTDYLDPSNWGLPATGVDAEWINETVVRYLEVAEVINRVDGVHYISALTVEGGVVDVSLATVGKVVLTRADTITVTVT